MGWYPASFYSKKALIMIEVRITIKVTFCKKYFCTQKFVGSVWHRMIIIRHVIRPPFFPSSANCCYQSSDVRLFCLLFLSTCTLNCRVCQTVSTEGLHSISNGNIQRAISAHTIFSEVGLPSDRDDRFRTNWNFRNSRLSFSIPEVSTRHHSHIGRLR